MKFYAFITGFCIGIVSSWNTARKFVNGNKNLNKKFMTLNSARRWILENVSWREIKIYELDKIELQLNWIYYKPKQGEKLKLPPKSKEGLNE